MLGSAAGHDGPHCNIRGVPQQRQQGGLILDAVQSLTMPETGVRLLLHPGSGSGRAGGFWLDWSSPA